MGLANVHLLRGQAADASRQTAKSRRGIYPRVLLFACGAHAAI
jgi:hypothetical protein